MTTNRLLGDDLRKAKNDIKSRYLAGESIQSVANEYGVSPRQVYYHLGPITPDEKATHARNAALRKILNKKNQVNSSASEAKIIRESDERRVHGEHTESPTEATESSLSDFIG